MIARWFSLFFFGLMALPYSHALPTSRPQTAAVQPAATQPVTMQPTTMQPATASPVQVLASIRPLALIAQAVLGNSGRAQQLLPEGASAHDYQLRASDRIALSRADVVLWIGPAHEFFLQSALQNSPAHLITAQTLAGIRLHPQRRQSDGRSITGSVDAHLWLNARNAVLIAHALAQQLGARDKAHAAQYQQNAQQFGLRMSALINQQQPKFAALKSRAFMAYHDAYQYTEPDFALHYRGSLSAHDSGTLSAQALQKTVQKIHTENIRCLLAEPGFNQTLANRVFNTQAGQAKNSARFAAIDEFFTAEKITPHGFEHAFSEMSEKIYQCVK